MFYRIFKYGIKNILRNKFLSFSSVIVLALLMFFVNLLMILHNLSNTLIDAVNSKLTLSLYLKDEYTKESLSVEYLLDEIRSTLPDVLIEFKSKEEVLEDMRKQDEELVNIIKTKNPLPATMNISNIKIEEYEILNRIIEGKYGMLTDFKNNTSYDYRVQYERILSILAILNTLKLALYIIIGIFLLAIFVITYSIIGNFIYHYRGEIAITKLVGGGNAFIYGPFLVQGMVYAILGFLFSTNIFLIFVNNAGVFFEKSTIKQYIINNDLHMILAIQLVLFILIGMLSSFLSARRYI